MATYSNLGIKLIQTGEESGTWGTAQIQIGILLIKR